MSLTLSKVHTFSLIKTLYVLREVVIAMELYPLHLEMIKVVNYLITYFSKIELKIVLSTTKTESIDLSKSLKVYYQ